MKIKTASTIYVEMTDEQLKTLLTGDFYENFAVQLCHEVVVAGAVDALYRLATVPDNSMGRALSDKLSFRSAYVLETIFFKHRELFIPYYERFCCDFIRCNNAGARRHFAKIMAHMLRDFTPPQEQCCAIAESCLEWTIEPRTRVAVKIWAIDVIRLLRPRIEWLDEAYNDIMEVMQGVDMPSVKCRMRGWSNSSIQKV